MGKKLYRSAKEKIIAGVCGGFGEYFEIDATVIRLVFVLLTFAGGIGILAYILSWIIMPVEAGAEVKSEKPSGTASQASAGEESASGTEIKVSATVGDKNKILLGLILIFLGTVFLINNFLPWFHIGRFWPLVLVFLGILFLIRPK